VKKHFKILVIDDEPAVVDGLRMVLGEQGYDVRTALTASAGFHLVEENDFDVVIADLQLPDRDGLELLREIKRVTPQAEVIIITGYGSVTKAVEATKAGAFFFVEKPFEPESLLELVSRALERRQLMRENEQMRHQLRQPDSYFDIVGKSKVMQDIFEVIESVAKSDANILIIGGSGTGKELIANAIHYNSLRDRKPFIKVNCAALPRELIESELFGHTKGAFTGATRDKDGLIGLANGGSLLLDEIAEMPIELQPKLLRVLQERVYRRLGSDKGIEVNFRLICSTNRKPEEAVRDGMLRDDLYYRISTITIEVPPLRERSEDIQLLADHFLQVFAHKYNKPVTGITQDAYSRLFAHSWPGNVRELENAIERAVLLSKGKQISAADLPFEKVEGQTTDNEFYIPPNMTLAEIERLVILKTLQRTEGNKQAAASMLGIYRPRLYNKIKKYRLTEFM